MLMQTRVPFFKPTAQKKKYIQNVCVLRVFVDGKQQSVISQ